MIINMENIFKFMFYNVVKNCNKRDDNNECVGHVNYNEYYYVRQLHNLLENNNMLHNFSFIDDVKRMIFYLDKAGLTLCYQFTMYSYVRSDIYAKIMELINSNARINHIALCHTNTLHKISMIRLLLLKYNMYINSFSTLHSNFKSETDIELTDGGIHDHIGFPNKQVKDAWCTTTRTEAINRLILMVEYFGKPTLEKCEVDFITYETSQHMSFHDVISYYKDTRKKIEKYINRYIMICDAFIDVTQVCYMMGTTYDDTYDLRKFKIVIENTNDDNDNDNALHMQMLLQSVSAMVSSQTQQIQQIQQIQQTYNIPFDISKLSDTTDISDDGFDDIVCDDYDVEYIMANDAMYHIDQKN
jgi:hypothetical protein